MPRKRQSAKPSRRSRIDTEVQAGKRAERVERRKSPYKSDSELVEQSLILDKALYNECAGPLTGDDDIDPDETDDDNPHEAGGDQETGT